MARRARSLTASAAGTLYGWPHITPLAVSTMQRTIAGYEWALESALTALRLIDQEPKTRACCPLSQNSTLTRMVAARKALASLSKPFGMAMYCLSFADEPLDEVGLTTERDVCCARLVAIGF
jgi:hypothetical protein